jgi:hypothetical protein
MITAQFRGAFSLAEKGTKWLSEQVGTVTMKTKVSN